MIEEAAPLVERHDEHGAVQVARVIERVICGQQLPTVLAGLKNEPPGVTAAAILVTLAAVLVVRPLWLFLTQVAPGYFGWQLGYRNPPLRWREALALTWAGTRGVITLAAVFAIPFTTSSHRPFPDRDLLLLCAYIVVLVTLVGQGLTFGPASVADSMRTALQRWAERHRFRMLTTAGGDSGWSPELEATIRAQHAVISAQRDELLRWRDSGRMSDEGLRSLQHELDLEERILPAR